MRHHSLFTGVTVFLAFAAPLGAQERTDRVTPRAERARAAQIDSLRRIFSTGIAADRAVLGVTLGEAGTTGIHVAEVAEDGPAAAAGIRVGDHLQAIDGVDLRVSPADAEDPRLRDAAARRLQRAMQRVTAGDEVTVRVQSGDAVRTVRVRTVRADSLARRRVMPAIALSLPNPDRATLGLSVTTTGTARDTLGAFVASVVSGGPAERAGIYEGARIVSVNGVSLRVDSADLRDPVVGRARAEQLSRELSRLTAGDEVTLRVWEAGRTRDVRVRTERQADVYTRDGRTGAMQYFPGGTFRFAPGTGSGGYFSFPREGGAWRIETEGDSTVIFRLPSGVNGLMRDGATELRRALPGIRIFGDSAGVRLFRLEELSPEMRARIGEQIEAARRRQQTSIEAGRVRRML